MAIREIDDLPARATIVASDLLHVKSASADVKVLPDALLNYFVANNTNPFAIDKTKVGLSNVLNVTQLDAAQNLLDLPNVTSARSNLSVDSSAEVDAKVAAHSTLTNNPHGVDKNDVGLGNVVNYPVSTNEAENSDTKYATIGAVARLKAQVDALSQQLPPSGSILLWPTNAAIPSGWAIMDGLSNPSGIDMRGKFVRGGDPFNVGSEGGSDTVSHSHSGTTTDDALTEAQMPVHKHGLVGRLLAGSGDSEGHGGRYSSSYTQDVNSTKILEAGGGEAHGHGLLVDSVALSNLPTYRTMIFIEKI